MTHRSLNSSEQESIAEFIHVLALTFKNSPDAIVKKMARTTIMHALWRWTADAINVKNGKLIQDKFKYENSVHHMTKSASEIIRQTPRTTERLRHEHAVPRKYLTDRILQHDLSKDEIVKLLRTYCCAVITTDVESDLLRKCSMPDQWDCKKGSRFARYEERAIALIPPGVQSTTI